ncbi:iron-containing alcohol dehydrogenase [Mycoplasmatota bacterium]|nr:iron-containing alcohol dehydrogenase [Mycoplasmatota bacterium]
MIWNLKIILYRIRHYIFKIAIKCLKFPVPELVIGAGCMIDLASKVKQKRLSNVLIVTDKVLMDLGLLDRLFLSLDEYEIKYTVYDRVQPNPTIYNIEEARQVYIDNQCEAMIAFGGGSPMDCAKVAAARVTNNKSIRDMKGLFKVRKTLPPLFAVPTTAGSGSETTVAAVVSDPNTHEKYAISDTKLVPKIAVLDPELTIGLPPHITSTTGMDALTHAVEAYIGLHGTKFTNKKAEKAVEIIFNKLEDVYNNGSDVNLRQDMALASYYAGSAFTRTSVGYVHAIAHNLGGLYGVPHGLANAVILPYILEYFGKYAENKLAKLAIIGGIGKKEEGEKVLASKFIEQIKNMNRNMNIPSVIKELKEEDIPLIAKRAIKEANPDYPVPKIMTEEECREVVSKLLVGSNN